jgi:hypothetical protein
MSIPAGKERILRLLEELGETQENMAASLQRLGIKGDPWSCIDCPLVIYLKQHSELLHLKVRRHGVDHAGGLLVHFLGKRHYISLFLADFDHGKYPELIRR